MNSVEAEIAEQLTGLCTFLVQGPPFGEGDEVDLVLKRDESAAEDDPPWLALNVTRPTESRDALGRGEREWGREVVLVRARLSRTGGVPRDSMNRAVEGYDPEALTLSDVRVIDRSPPDAGRPG